MSKPSNEIRIYLKDSDKARLADCRVRIVRDSNHTEPCNNEDLVFEKAEDEDHIPKNALYKWKFHPYGCEPIWFFTTAKRCKKMVSKDPSCWTLPKLKKFADIEHRLYEDWYNGRVYGYITEKWDEKQRWWTAVSSLYGLYGVKDLFDNLAAAKIDGVSIPVCVDEETMKYEFRNVEWKVNGFVGNTPDGFVGNTPGCLLYS